MNYKSIIYKMFLFLIICSSFFFTLIINAKARVADDDTTTETKLDIRCEYEYDYVVGYKDGNVFGVVPNTARGVSVEAITLAEFKKAAGGHFCPTAVYSKLYVVGYTATEHMQFNYDKSYSKMDLVNEIITEPSNPSTDTYKTCLYGTTGDISINYNSTEITIEVANNNGQIITSMNASNFTNGCPAQVYTLSVSGYYAVHAQKGEEGSYSEQKLYDPQTNTDYTEFCAFNGNASNPIYIYGNNKGDYYVKSDLGCDTSNFDGEELSNGCGANIYYNITTDSNGKKICDFSIDPSKGYGDSNSNKNGRTVNCSDFIYYVDKDGKLVADGTGTPVNLVSELFNIIMIIGPILALVLGGVDFAKATLQSDESALKKAGTNFGKRIAAAILLFLLPLIINLVLGIAFGAGVFGTMEEVPNVCLINK